MCFLPLYMVSAVFRITTFILLLTYLNVWAFLPMIVSLILNICSVQFSQTTLEKKSNRSNGCISKNLVAATAAVFIPIGIIEPFPGKLCNISRQNCFSIKKLLWMSIFCNGLSHTFVDCLPNREIVNIHAKILLQQSTAAFLSLAIPLVITILLINDVIPINYEPRSPLNFGYATFLTR